MSIQSIITALQTRHALIAGVVSAPVAYPASFASTDLPLLLTDLTTFTERHESHYEDTPTFEGQFRVRGFCMPTGQGQGIDEGKQKALTILEALLASYRADADLTATAFIHMQASEALRGAVRDGLPYGEMTYYGFEILVPIQERFG